MEFYTVPKNAPQAVKVWHGHLWNWKQCGIRYVKGECEHGAGLLAAAIAAQELQNSLSPPKIVPRGTISGYESKKETLSPLKNLRDSILPVVEGQQEFLHQFLKGSQAKTAFAIRMNAEKMCWDGGLNSIGFLTLTVGQYNALGGFEQVREANEASRRINNLNRRVLPVLFEKAIVVTERHKSGAIHFHILGILRGRPDIRTGLNFEEIAKRNYRSASPKLKKLWAYLREKLPDYGFGRAELLPVKKTGEAIASYVSKYIEKTVANRLPQDAHKKLVRYLGWEKDQLKANEFEWDGEKAKAWRGKAREILGLVGCQLVDNVVNPALRVIEACVRSAGAVRPKMLNGSDAKDFAGPRWAYYVDKLMVAFSPAKVPFLVLDYESRSLLKREVARLNVGWCRRRDAKKSMFAEEAAEMRALFGGQAIENLSKN